MNAKKSTLLKCIVISLAVGAVSGLLSAGGMEIFKTLEKPPLSPPGWLFPVVWTILYILMGIASFLVLTSESDSQDRSKALALYFYQLIVNFLWPIFFFDFRWYLFSFLWIVLLWVLIVMMIRCFYRVSKTAAYLLIPYLLWVTFAGYLNAGIWKLN